MGWRMDSLETVADGLDWTRIYCCVCLNNDFGYKIDSYSILYHID